MIEAAQMILLLTLNGVTLRDKRQNGDIRNSFKGNKITDAIEEY